MTLTILPSPPERLQWYDGEFLKSQVTQRMLPEIWRVNCDPKGRLLQLKERRLQTC